MSASKRKRRQDELDNIVSGSSTAAAAEDLFNVGNVAQIFFQSGEAPIVLKDGTNFYSYQKCDYDKQLIGSSEFWHQIIVSLLSLD